QRHPGSSSGGAICTCCPVCFCSSLWTMGATVFMSYLLRSKLRHRAADVRLARSTTHPPSAPARHAGIMSLIKPMSDTRTVADNSPPGRDRAVDVARLVALVVVMFGHCALLLATIDASGLRIGNLLGELPAIAPVTWVVQVMPLFFLA